jgi:hypothetical protein
MDTAEFAAASGITVRQAQYWMEHGLLHPVTVTIRTSSTGYWRYDWNAREVQRARIYKRIQKSYGQGGPWDVATRITEGKLSCQFLLVCRKGGPVRSSRRRPLFLVGCQTEHEALRKASAFAGACIVIELAQLSACEREASNP